VNRPLSSVELRKLADKLDRQGEFEHARWLRGKAAEPEHGFIPDAAPRSASPVVDPLYVPQNRGMDGKRRAA
jgi:hypothetical protein